MANKLPPFAAIFAAATGKELPQASIDLLSQADLSDEDLLLESERLSKVTGRDSNEIFKLLRSNAQREADARSEAKKSQRNQVLQRGGRSSTILTGKKNRLPQGGAQEQTAQRPSGGIFSRAVASLLQGPFGTSVPGGQLGIGQNQLQAFRGANALLG